jgi:hypothetical protein
MDDYRFGGYPDELLQAFAMSEEHPVRQGLLYILNEAMKGEAFTVAATDLSDSQRHYQAGRLAMMQDMYFGFETLFQDALGQKESDPTP